MDRTALVVGASGIIGSHAAQELIAEGWTVHGLARQPRDDVKGLPPVAADLLDPASLEAALARVDPTHVFLTSWMRNATEAENIRVNGAMVRNLLQAAVSVAHFASAALTYSDGSCRFCDEGLPTSCVHGGFFGNGGKADGAQAEAL